LKERDNNKNSNITSEYGSPYWMHTISTGILCTLASRMLVAATDLMSTLTMLSSLAALNVREIPEALATSVLRVPRALWHDCFGRKQKTL
jgi:hypothetical protein